ncbi:RING finger and CHY zinc finger domain-containing protein 1-like [Mercenaria mercenaria]|uniref:RING finger and CHY zinc finger domain-containing protein 1-like n=1 Tax=Mercenaria mercenaria TaxID=6596 RepID=UPI00234F81D0|nr:RING finger and CHY zinc finger domain-containing protein 1-like [Mercenaria mercenaria]XP_053386252.1 RING finger and CHY zinc finger domain-containing protein 1-like [Mercenaria mercenaria]
MLKLAVQNSTGAQSSQTGCKHYQRKCCFIAPCCKKMYVCRLCHDESESHEMIRTEVTEIVCMVCRKIQEVRRKCSSCNTIFGEYFCEKCRLYDDDVTKGQFHCDRCGLCRIGGKANYFHCETCSICLSLSLKNNHQCRKWTSRRDCPICHEDIHTSVKDGTLLSCGHIIHSYCLQKYQKLQGYSQVTCPICG